MGTGKGHAGEGGDGHLRPPPSGSPGPHPYLPLEPKTEPGPLLPSALNPLSCTQAPRAPPAVHPSWTSPHSPYWPILLVLPHCPLGKPSLSLSLSSQPGALGEGVGPESRRDLGIWGKAGSAPSVSSTCPPQPQLPWPSNENGCAQLQALGEGFW